MNKAEFICWTLSSAKCFYEFSSAGPSVCRSVLPFSQDWLITFFLVFA